MLDLGLSGLYTLKSKSFRNLKIIFFMIEHGGMLTEKMYLNCYAVTAPMFIVYSYSWAHIFQSYHHTVRSASLSQQEIFFLN